MLAQEFGSESQKIKLTIKTNKMHSTCFRRVVDIKHDKKNKKEGSAFEWTRQRYRKTLGRSIKEDKKEFEM